MILRKQILKKWWWVCGPDQCNPESTPAARSFDRRTEVSGSKRKTENLLASRNLQYVQLLMKLPAFYGTWKLISVQNSLSVAPILSQMNPMRIL
jgi:hypothetical protein